MSANFVNVAMCFCTLTLFSSILIHHSFILIVCCIVQRAVTAIAAHNSPLAAVSFDSQGTLIATASEKVCKRCYSL